MSEHALSPTTFSAVTCFMVACDGGYLSVNELQLEGKKRMKVEDFLRGYSIKEGTVLS